MHHFAIRADDHRIALLCHRDRDAFFRDRRTVTQVDDALSARERRRDFHKTISSHLSNSLSVYHYRDIGEMDSASEFGGNLNRRRFTRFSIGLTLLR